jgi:hypothetical protein
VTITLVASVGLAISLGVLSDACGESARGACILRLVCWVLVVGGVAGTFLAGAGCRWGWLLLLGLQPVWISYALVTAQHGFVLGSLAYAGAQLNGFLRASRQS